MNIYDNFPVVLDLVSVFDADLCYRRPVVEDPTFMLCLVLLQAVYLEVFALEG
jgi:hypothetical protein